MATDIKLDQRGGNWVLIEGGVLKCTATDFMLDAPTRRGVGSGPHRRALVHSDGDSLTINFANDYSGGVTVVGGLLVTGDIKVAGRSVALGARLDELYAQMYEQEQTIAALVQLIGAVIVPAWRTKEEVEEGDDMGMVSPSAADLGLVVEYEHEESNPDFGYEDVIRTTPPPGTPVLPGTTIRVCINL